MKTFRFLFFLVSLFSVVLFASNWAVAADGDSAYAKKKITGVSEGGYQFITAWGSEGKGNGQFTFLYGVAVDTSGNVYVADTDEIQKFSSTGVFITKWGSYGKGNGQFIYPSGVAVDASGNVYVVDSGNCRIQKFGPVSAGVTPLSPAADADMEKILPIQQPKPDSTPATQPAIIDVSGQWKGSNGLMYDIKQEKDEFEWTIKGKEEKAWGVLKGSNISVAWFGIVSTEPFKGKITAVDSAGRAKQIDWNNGLRFYR